MSDQILTEEELKDFVKEVIILKGLKIKSSMDLIKSHRHLLSANAELSFKNIVYKSALKNILKVDEDLAEYSLNVIENLAKQALEEDK